MTEQSITVSVSMLYYMKSWINVDENINKSFLPLLHGQNGDRKLTFETRLNVPSLFNVFPTYSVDPILIVVDPAFIYLSSKLCGRRGGLMVSALVPGLNVRVRDLAGDTVLCSWARHFTLTVPLSIQEYK